MFTTTVDLTMNPRAQLRLRSPSPGLSEQPLSASLRSLTSTRENPWENSGKIMEKSGEIILVYKLH